MKSASSALISYLNSGLQFYMADLYIFTLVGGYVARYTSADMDLTVDGNRYSQFLIKRGNTKVSVGTETDENEITIYAGPTDMLNGTPWLQAVAAGALDSAQLSLLRLFMPTPGDTSLGTIIMPGGRVSDVEVTRTQVVLKVRSELELLDTQLPRNQYQSGCLNTLFDNGCGINQSSFSSSGSISSGSTTTQINTSLGQAADFFALGRIKFQSGVNVGITRSVRSFSGGVFGLSLPLITPPAAGDTFIAYPGCDKTQSTCTNKFSNVVNFRGFPYVPDPETAA